MGLPRPQSQGSNRPQGSVFRPSSAASLEPWSLQERPGSNATVIELPTPEKSPSSLAKFARERQRSIGLGSLWDTHWLQSSRSADTELLGLSPFKSSGDGSSRSWTRPHRGRSRGKAANSAWGRLDLGICRDQLAQEALLARRKLKANESDVMSKKANAAKALAMDRQRAEEKRKEAKESLSDYNARRRLDVERQLKRIFCPIQEPHLAIPAYWQNLNVDFTGKVVQKTSAKPKGHQKPEPVVFVEIEPAQQVELLNMCQHFTTLTRPFQPAGESDAAILTRPAFCRLLLELTIADSGGTVMYHSAIEIFDLMATTQSLKGLPLTSTTVLGILLDDHSDRVIQLFAGLLAQASRESKNGATPEEFKLHLLDCLLPHAERKLRRRQKHIDAGLAYGKDIYRLPLLAENGDEEEEEDEMVADNSPKTPDAAPGPSKSKRENLLGTLSVPSAANSRMSSRARSKASFAPRGEEVQEFEVDDDEERTDLIGRRSWVWDGMSTHSDEEEDDRKGQTEEDAMYAHTCMVSKGEYLTSMFLEPEIIQLIWMYFDRFEYLFSVYQDTPTNFLVTPGATEGHMSNEAFLQFCIDFQLFPQIIDFNSLNCYYQSAESIIELTRDEIKRCTHKDEKEASFQVGDVVELPSFLRGGKKGGKVKPGDPLKVIAVDCSDVDAEAVLVMTARLKKLWVKIGAIKKAEKNFVSSDKAKASAKVASKATWINKSFEEMSEVEKRSLTILSSFADYMTSRKVRAKDFFSKFDETGDGQIDADELMKGITFMSLQGSLRTSISSPPPSFEDVEALFRLIDADGDGTLDYVELDIVMKTVQERKSKQTRSANFFIKDDAEMTELEKAALNFFVPLWNYMEANKKTVKDIYAKFDKANHGHLSFRQMREIGEELGFTCNYSKFDRAMMLVDGNLDGAVSPEELQKVLNFVKVRMDMLYKREQDKKDELKNPFANKVTEQTKTDNEKNYKIACFGVKAFIESILRIGFGHLSFHGTPEQSTLPTASKALWVITHLQRQLSLIQLNEETTVAEDVMSFNKRMGWEAALTQFGNKRKNLDKVMEEFRSLGYKPRNEEELEENPWSDVSHLERIKCERPDLFLPLPSMRPVVAGKNYERKAACPECKAEPQNGWGNMYCPKCAHADGMIRACLANNKHYDLHKLPTLDRIICLLGTHTTPPGPMHRDDGTVKTFAMDGERRGSLGPRK